MVGVLLYDWSRFRWALAPVPGRWMHAGNRADVLDPAPDGGGVRCVALWSSALHAPTFFPSLGKRLMRRALAEQPIARSEAARPFSSDPEVTFVIGHRGRERHPQLLATLRSVAAQAGAAVECVVVEQAAEAESRTVLPPWVRYVHQPSESPYNRAAAFNLGARHARGQVLVFHDGDLLVPSRYAAVALQKAREGFEVANLNRFIFYLSEADTFELLAGRADPGDAAPESIVQNARGGSLMATREGFTRIGGFDEEFVGWGGEDVEFWERAGTLRLYPYGCLPLVHLWHRPQPGKTPAKDTPAMKLYQEKSQLPVELRIQELRDRSRLREQVAPCST